MKWFTCIIHVPWHVSPVQYFHTRAETPQDAAVHAQEWLADPDHGRPDVEHVFEGKMEPVPHEMSASA